VHQIRREEPAAQKLAEEIIALSTEQGFPYYLADGINLQGWTLAEQGQGEVGIAKMRQSQTAYQAIGVEMQRPFFLAPLAAAYGKIGQVEEGLSVLAETLTIVDKTEICLNEAELYRLKGELTLQSSVQSLGSRVKEAEACFQKAIEIAQWQQAKSWELRASTSLARLWQQQGKRAEAHKLLYEVYHWFTEGFDTKDLQEAEALLEELT
jgi:predicted ATPase